ncbi:ABC transporter permease [Kribbella antibiotica]|uniref:ABC transporter permease n=1 Tax=Kribbella antibiotica TaxID=190195 RepID=UPI00192DC0AF|nr:ABC transporter permease [Kribbella antibiotica]
MSGAVETPAPQLIEGPVDEPRPPAVKRFLSAWLVRRLAKALLTIFLVSTLTFFLVRLLPGNPVDTYIQTQIAQTGISYADAAAQAQNLFSLDPDEPLILQYVTYMGNLVQGDFGVSLLSPGTTVAQVIQTYLPWTLFSVGIAQILSFVLGVIAGMIMAYRRESWIDHLLTSIGSLLHAIPNYIVAILIVVFLGVKLQVFNLTEARGSYTPGVEPSFSLSFLNDILYHATLPILAYLLTTVGSWALVMKSSTVETLGEDYVTVARARGLTDNRIRSGYVGRNAVLPLFSQLAVSLGFVVGGSIFVEKIFGYQGIGFSLYNAVSGRDYPVLQGIFLVVTISVVVANLLADVLYSRLDPRIRVGGKAKG